jgi:beta-N-acetylhexosaminidase
MNKIIQYLIVIALLILGVVSWTYFEKINRIVIASREFNTIPHFKASSIIDLKLENMSLRQKVSSLFILHTPGTNDGDLSSFLDEYSPSGLIFMGDNIPSSLAELKSLTGNIQNQTAFPYLFAVDEEGGVVSRIAEDTYPAASQLKSQPASSTYDAFSQRSVLLNQVGLNLNFGIVADITDESGSFIYNRVFGGSPILAGARVTEAVKGSEGLSLSTLKHFPGHGATPNDSHSSVPTTDKSLTDWQSSDMISFQDGINSGADAVMFGHLRFSSVDSLPASLSPRWHSILRDDMGFNGLIVTDDMIMLQNSGDSQFANPINNAILAINAGNDLLVYVLGADRMVGGVEIDSIIDGVAQAVNDGRISLVDLNSSVRRVLSVRHSLLGL